MRQWLDILAKVQHYGERRSDRTGVGTYSLFGEMLRFRDVGEQFPAVTTKTLAFKQVCAELACFIRGYDNLEQFHEMGCTIWDANSAAPYWKPKEPGDLGRIYGVQWRDWKSIEADDSGWRSTDQLTNLVKGLKTDPYSRRHVVTAWNPGELDNMVLPPCHAMFQASVREGGRLDLCVTMRSVDLFLGLPFDVASYAVLLCLLAKEVGLVAGDLAFMMGDAHIYQNHLDAVETVLSRHPLPPPKLVLANESLFGFYPDYAILDGYKSHGKVLAEMNV